MELAGFILAAAVAVVATGPWLADMVRQGLTRPNYRDARPAFPSGAVAITCSLIALAPLAVLDDRADLDLLDPELRRWGLFILGMALLGLLDDALGRGAHSDSSRGWRGHAAALLGGRFSTGFVKAAGGFALAAWAATGLGFSGLDYVVALLLLLLVTNLFNLIDLRPGRVEKALLLVLVGVCIGGWTLFPVELLGLFAAPVLVGAVYTLREKAMLGDTGANLAGALAGVALLVSLDDTGRLVALVIVAAVTAYAEFRSLSQAVDRIPPLRWLDSLGRVNEQSRKADQGG